MNEMNFFTKLYLSLKKRQEWAYMAELFLGEIIIIQEASGREIKK